MAKEIIYLTAEGYKKLKEELDHLRSVERPAISAAIAEARDKGDLSENAEYDAAREAHEANLREGKLAIGTPIAKALLGRKKGDCVDVDVPAGTIHFEILDISI